MNKFLEHATLWFSNGAPDLRDIAAGGALDPSGSLGRELLEGTGLDISGLAAKPGMALIAAGRRYGDDQNNYLERPRPNG
jgi:hypothetical protein